jgi:hypothetical protein
MHDAALGRTHAAGHSPVRGIRDARRDADDSSAHLLVDLGRFRQSPARYPMHIHVFPQFPSTPVDAVTQFADTGTLGEAYTDTGRLLELVEHLEESEVAPPDFRGLTDDELFRAANAARAQLNSVSGHTDRARTYDTLDAITEELRHR